VAKELTVLPPQASKIPTATKTVEATTVRLNKDVFFMGMAIKIRAGRQKKSDLLFCPRSVDKVAMFTERTYTSERDSGLYHNNGPMLGGADISFAS
jgi:hypothetical protein